MSLREFFEQVADAVVGFLPPELGPPSTRLTGGNVKMWFGDEPREHYEAQFLRDGTFEVGFHTEHRAAERNETVIRRLLDAETTWRASLGAGATPGPFVGAKNGPWRRLSEVWTRLDGLDVDTAVDVAERLASYAEAIEPVRRGWLTPRV